MSVLDNPPAASQRILVRGVNWLGDAVMTTPALLRLREAHPKASISLLTPEKLADLWRDHPAVDAVLCAEKQETVWRIGQRLREQHFETSLVFPNSTRSALEVWLARIPRRIGYRRAWRSWLLTDRVPDRAGAVRMQKRSAAQVKRLAGSGAGRDTARSMAGAHHMHNYLHLAKALGADPQPLAPLLQVSDDEANRVCQKFGLRFDPTCPSLFAVNPGAEYGPAKRWPADKFAAVVRQVREQAGGVWLIVGGPGDTALADELLRLLQPSKPNGTLNLAGRTTLRELMALLKCCRVLLTNDTGPMHVAAGLGTPVVALFGSTSAELTAPGLPGEPRHQLLVSDVACAPCFLRECPIDFRCMNQIGVERVVEAVLRSIELSRPR